MSIQTITSNRLKGIFNTIIYILIFSFSFYIFGCVSTSEVTYKGENISKTNPGEINEYSFIKIIKKTGETINVEGLGARFYKYFKDTENVIVWVKNDTTWLEQNGHKAYKVKATEQSVPLSDILEVYVEKEEVNSGITVLVILGIAAFAFLIVLATKQSCPFFYSFDGGKYVFDSESFGGAITEGLKRTDYSRMEYLKPSDGFYKIMIRNEADESQYIDELKLFAIDHPENTEVIPDYDGNYTAFSKSYEPLKVTDEKNNGITSFFKSRDGVYWQSYMEMDSSILKSDIRHKLTFNFKKPQNAKKAKLLINAGSTLWGSRMLKEILIMHGDKVDDWYREMNKQGIALNILKTWEEREELFDMKLYMKEGDNFVQKNKLTSGGPYTIEDRIIDLDLSNISGDEFSLQINPPKGFWKIDYMGIVYEYDDNYKLQEMPMISAVDYKGKDLLKALSGIDKIYYEMPTNDDIAYLNYKAIPLKNGNTRTMYLKSTGYYDIHLKKNEPYNKEFFENIIKPGYIVQFSFLKYLEKYYSYVSKN
jgi:hypothetical protein